MSQLIASLKAEISRVTRKEIKACAASMKQFMTEQRKEIAALRNQLTAVMRELTEFREQSGNSMAAMANELADEAAAVQGKRFSAKGLRAHRKRLDLSADQYALLLGVSAPSVYAWEQGRVRPRPRQLAQLIELRNMGKREILQRLRQLGG